MSAMNHRDQGERAPYEPISADDGDRLPRSAPRRTGIVSSVCCLLFLLLLCLAAAFYVLKHYTSLLHPDAPGAQGRATVSDPVPPIYTTTRAPTTRPLLDCIKPDNLIDEAVVTCHYGQYPQVVVQGNGPGMVSAQYMARFKADRPAPHQTHTTNEGIEQATIWQWDGKRTYFAQWLVEANRIDDGSVCGNYRRGSIEYRECRKGAKVYFRDQCKEWGKRSDQNGAAVSRFAQERFCSAASTFNPMG